MVLDRLSHEGRGDDIGDEGGVARPHDRAVRSRGDGGVGGTAHPPLCPSRRGASRSPGLRHRGRSARSHPKQRAASTCSPRPGASVPDRLIANTAGVPVAGVAGVLALGGEHVPDLLGIWPQFCGAEPGPPTAPSEPSSRPEKLQMDAAAERRGAGCGRLAGAGRGHPGDDESPAAPGRRVDDQTGSSATPHGTPSRLGADESGGGMAQLARGERPPAVISGGAYVRERRPGSAWRGAGASTISAPSTSTPPGCATGGPSTRTPPRRGRRRGPRRAR